jgi:hypothetical protein
VTIDEPSRFGLMLRRPGDVANDDADFGAPDEYEGIYVAPDFTTRHEKYSREVADAGDDPRWGNEKATHWALSLPHQCSEWVIGEGPREDVLADARRLRIELDQAIAAMEASRG